MVPHSIHLRDFKKGEKTYTAAQGQPVAQLINDMKSDLSNQSFLELTKAITDSTKGDLDARAHIGSMIKMVL